MPEQESTELDLSPYQTAMIQEAVSKYLDVVGEHLVAFDKLPSHRRTAHYFLNGIAANIGNRSDLSDQLQELVFDLNNYVHGVYQLENVNQS